MSPVISPLLWGRPKIMVVGKDSLGSGVSFREVISFKSRAVVMARIGFSVRGRLGLYFSSKG